MTQDELKKYLARYGLKPSHMLGQNFLMDEEVLDKMILASGFSKDAAVLEIGPGIGNLTKKLLEAGADVLAVEKDEHFKPLLNSLKKKNTLTVIYEDALGQDWTSLLAEHFGTKPVSVVANIPYYITGKLIQALLPVKQVKNLTLLVQKEVAQNIAAKPGKLNLLGLSVQLTSDSSLVCPVPAKSFYPAPKVDSCVIRIEKHVAQKHEYTEKDLFRVARAAFSGKRKQIHNTLTNNLHLESATVEAVLKKLKIPKTARPQELTVEQWVELTQAIESL